jgi:hypothetical protein
MHDKLWGDGKPPTTLKDNSAELQREGEQAEAVRKAKLKNKIDSLKEANDVDKTFNSIAQQQNEELYRHELISVQEYFDKKTSWRSMT